MERKEVDHITSLLNMSANVAAQNYPSLKTAIGDLVAAYNEQDHAHATRRGPGRPGVVQADNPICRKK